MILQIPGKFLARGGRPGEVLVKVAEEEDADVIVVGTRGHGKLRRAIMGTVSDYVTHHAPCPVMVCRHKVSENPTAVKLKAGKAERFHLALLSLKYFSFYTFLYFSLSISAGIHRNYFFRADTD